MKDNEQIVKEAYEFLKGKVGTFDYLFALAKKLIGSDDLGLARKVLERLEGSDAVDIPFSERRKFCQKWALTTYKDPHLPRHEALDRAFEILNQNFDLKQADDVETLGLAGAIFKRKWETNAARKHLSRSAGYYRAGYDAWKSALKKSNEGQSLSELEQENADEGYYPSINAAFVLDLLVNLESEEVDLAGIDSVVINDLQTVSAAIRQDVIDVLKPEMVAKTQFGQYDYWKLVSLAEASLGLGDFPATREWLTKAKTVEDINEWEYVTTAKQLVHLAQIKHGTTSPGAALEQTEAWKALIDFLGDNATGLRSLFYGKVGLGLSGGGFRASLYHIGVLAKLAELDLLRHIEVISCVSGGSIVGAHYYLELRRLFDSRAEAKPHHKVTRDDYIALVEKVAADFLEGVQANPRIQILANPFPNFKMLISSVYSRTTRLGELYESLIYSKVADDKQGDQRWINDYLVYPPEQGENFIPRRHNWSRAAKIPELVLNATNLNSGHNFQFTATWMGESPHQVEREVDTNSRYRRMYYQGEAPEAFQQVRLGTAVGASSCVPGLFEPIALDGLYPDSVIRLVDGGVYDNQGISGLLEQDCNVLIISDASGQLCTDADPGGGILKPLLRMNSTLMSRVRGAQYEDIKARNRSSLVRDYVYIHLKAGLDGTDVNWVDCEMTHTGAPGRDTATTAYGVRKDIQQLLADVRTDLDSFSDIEAFALMTSGYMAMGHSAKRLSSLPLGENYPEHAWDFLKVRSGMIANKNPMYHRLKKHLAVAPGRFLKVWKLDPVLRSVGIVVLLLVAAGLIYLVWRCPDCKPLDSISSSLTLASLTWLALGLVAGYVITAVFGGKKGARLHALLNFRDTIRRMVISLIVSPLVALGALLHLHVFDKRFKELGKVE